MPRLLVISVAGAAALVGVTTPASADVPGLICANPIPGLVSVSATSTHDSAGFHDVTATCPFNKHLVGTGYELTGASGEAAVDDFRPNGNSTNAAPTAVYVRADEEDPFAGDWSITAYAICATA